MLAPAMREDEHLRLFHTGDHPCGYWPGRVARDLVFDPETLKLLLEELCLQAGVQVQLYTRVVAAVKDERNRLMLALTESKSGRQGWPARR